TLSAVYDKPESESHRVESATLAAIIRSPNRLSPWSDRAAARESRNVVLGRMRDLGFVDRQRCAAAQSEDVLIGNRQNAQGQTYAVDYIRQKVIEAVGWNRAMNEGFRIHTTIDSDLQKRPRTRCDHTLIARKSIRTMNIRPTR